MIFDWYEAEAHTVAPERMRSKLAERRFMMIARQN